MGSKMASEEPKKKIFNSEQPLEIIENLKRTRKSEARKSINSTWRFHDDC